MNRSATDQASERRSRLIEVGLSVAASVIASSVVASWTLSEALATYAAKIDEHDRALNFKQQQIAALESRQLAYERTQAQGEAHYSDILRRLDSIDQKLESRRRE